MAELALLGGSFDPPGIHHRELARILCTQFDAVRVVTCGPRSDKTSINYLDPVHRAVMSDLNFSGISKKLRVDLFDLEHDSFTPNWELQQMYSEEGNVWHVVGSDLVEGGAEGKSLIQRTWKNGRSVWENFNLAVFTRPGYPLIRQDLPPHSRVIECDIEGSSSLIRENRYRGVSVSGLVLQGIEKYMDRYGLYLSRPPQYCGFMQIERNAFMIVHDKVNPAACALAEKLNRFESSNPELIVAIGGDGTILNCARKYWRKRIPIFGINAGHLGYLSNGRDEVFGSDFPPGALKVWNLPLLYYEAQDVNGKIITGFAFNDVHVRNQTNYRKRKLQSAWVSVVVGGMHEHKICKLAGDGALIATMQGSTAYAKAMGAAPVRLDSRALVISGNNVSFPEGWRGTSIDIDSDITFTNLDSPKRPIEGFADSDLILSHLSQIKIRRSRIANVQLAFLSGHDLARKQAESSFPK